MDDCINVDSAKYKMAMNHVNASARCQSTLLHFNLRPGCAAIHPVAELYPLVFCVLSLCSTRHLQT